MRNASDQQGEKCAAVKKKKSEQEHKQQNVLWANTIAFPP